MWVAFICEVAQILFSRKAEGATCNLRVGWHPRLVHGVLLASWLLRARAPCLSVVVSRLSREACGYPLCKHVGNMFFASKCNNLHETDIMTLRLKRLCRG